MRYLAACFLAERESVNGRKVAGQRYEVLDENGVDGKLVANQTIKNGIISPGRTLR